MNVCQKIVNNVFQLIFRVNLTNKLKLLAKVLSSP
jgi:hypothetical protein